MAYGSKAGETCFQLLAVLSINLSGSFNCVDVVMSQDVKKITMFRAYLHQSLEKEVEVITARGEPIYGRLMGYSLNSDPPVIILENVKERYFLNLRYVERIRCTIQ